MKHIEVWIGTMQLKDEDRMCYRERADTWVGVLGGGRKWGRPPRWREGGGCMWVENASCQVPSLVSDSIQPSGLRSASLLCPWGGLRANQTKNQLCGEEQSQWAREVKGDGPGVSVTSPFDAGDCELVVILMVLWVVVGQSSPAEVHTEHQNDGQTPAPSPELMTDGDNDGPLQRSVGDCGRTDSKPRTQQEVQALRAEHVRGREEKGGGGKGARASVKGFPSHVRGLDLTPWAAGSHGRVLCWELE